jgi:hypothetical protein
MKLPKNYYLAAYNDDQKLGVYFYDEWIFDYKKEYGLRSYKFIFELLSETHFFEESPSEKIQFITTCNLRNYLSEFQRPDFEGKKLVYRKEIDFDPEKLTRIHAPNLYNYHIRRLKRKIQKHAPSPVICNVDSYYSGMEFLEFTKKSAYRWVGPFKQGGKLGACIKVRGPSEFNPPILDVRTSWTYWLLPSSERESLDFLAEKENNPEIPNGDYFTYRWTPEQKAKYFESLTNEQKYLISKQFYPKYASYIKETAPYSIYLCGNGNRSYTKYLTSEKEVAEELNYLRMMQPLDFTLDIIDRGYIFTN